LRFYHYSIYKLYNEKKPLLKPISNNSYTPQMDQKSIPESQKTPEITEPKPEPEPKPKRGRKKTLAT
jgi:hypothetical protein